MSTERGRPGVFLAMARELAARRRALLGATLFTAAVVAVALTPQLLGTRVFAAFDAVGDAKAPWLWLTAIFVVTQLVASAQAWRALIESVGGSVSRVDASARYAIGAAVNTFLPARLGDVVRIGLFARRLPRADATWTTAGAYTTIGAARALWTGILVAVAISAGTLPLWAAAGSVLFVAATVVASVVARRRNPQSHVAHFFDAYRELGRRPREAAPLLVWTGVATAARVAAAAAVVSALGIGHPLSAALLIVPALEAGALLPLAPGAVGLSNGAVVIALKGIGVGGTAALSVGIGLHAVEAIAGVTSGLLGALVLAGEHRPLVRRAAVALAGVCLAVGVAGSFGFAVPDFA
jgi:uncharacterized membrane protein YbhN (UPF0104 family)